MSVSEVLSYEQGRKVFTSIPHAEVWTPTRPMLNDSLPIPPSDAASLRKLLLTGQRRRETTAMRQVWKAKRTEKVLPERGVLEQYKHMLQARDGVRSTQTPNHQLLAKKEQSILQSPHGLMKSFPQSKDSPPIDQPAQRLPLTVSANDTKYEKTKPGCAKETISQDKKHVTSYSQDYVQKIGLVSLPKVPIRTLSADWWNEIQKKPMTRLSYSEPMTVVTDRKKIDREIVGKFFVKNSTQTYFQVTVPRHLHTYNIHPEFDSEYQRCWQH